MEIELNELKSLLGGGGGLPFEPGEAYFVRTVTFYYTGRAVRVGVSYVVLADAAWIADSGRFADCLKTGECHEIEPYPGEVTISFGAVVDFCKWNHPLPRDQK